MIFEKVKVQENEYGRGRYAHKLVQKGVGLNKACGKLLTYIWFEYIN